MSPPQLSAVTVVGEERERARAVVEAIAAQTAADAIELILVDLCPDAARLADPPGLRTLQLVLPPSTPWGEARAAGVRGATSPVVAFIEDHATPDPGWAEALIEAHRQPWSTVAYAFLPGDPDRWASRSTLIGEYGVWAHPVIGGRARKLPGNNLSYKRDLLLALGDQLGPALMIDDNLHRRFAAQGLEGAVEPRALVRHHELDSVWNAAVAGYDYGRVLAASRAAEEHWPAWRRVAWAIMLPLGAPAARAARLVRSLRGRRPLWGQAVSALPVTALLWLLAGIGQTVGCLFGLGESKRRLKGWELGSTRSLQQRGAISDGGDGGTSHAPSAGRGARSAAP